MAIATSCLEVGGEAVALPIPVSHRIRTLGTADFLQASGSCAVASRATGSSFRQRALGGRRQRLFRSPARGFRRRRFGLTIINVARGHAAYEGAPAVMVKAARARCRTKPW